MITENTHTKIVHGDQIVSFVKRISREISNMRFSDNIDYLGCSTPYVREKISILIADLKWIDSRVKEDGKKK